MSTLPCAFSALFVAIVGASGSGATGNHLLLSCAFSALFVTTVCLLHGCSSGSGATGNFHVDDAMKVISLNLADNASGGVGCEPWEMKPVVVGQMEGMGFEFGGFQEPRRKLEETLGHSAFGVYQSAEKDYPHTNPAPVAWNKGRYQTLDANHKEVGRDSCGSRVVEYVKVKDYKIWPYRTIFFANTHGPTEHCGSPTSEHDYDANLARVVREEGGDSDVIIVTGDFNVHQAPNKLNQLSAILPEHVGSGTDWIFSNVPCTGGMFDGGCSDHNGVQATCIIR